MIIAIIIGSKVKILKITNNSIQIKSYNYYENLKFY